MRRAPIVITATVVGLIGVLEFHSRPSAIAVATIPAYARPLEGPFGEGLRIGVQEALKHLLEEIEEGGHVDRLDVYRGLGQGEMRAGRRTPTTSGGSSCHG